MIKNNTELLIELRTKNLNISTYNKTLLTNDNIIKCKVEITQNQKKYHFVHSA